MRDGKSIYICGNGGSAANALHIANDLIYGVRNNNKDLYKTAKIEALPANSSVVTCLANDIGYERIYSYQLECKGVKDDILICLSGSGNSDNIYNALNTANKIGMETFSILGFDGGKCKSISKNSIHFCIDDMQIAEDTQLIVMHMCMQWLADC